LGVKTPQDMIFGGLNRRFKPNLRNFRIAISRKVCTRSTYYLAGVKAERVHLCLVAPWQITQC